MSTLCVCLTWSTDIQTWILYLLPLEMDVYLQGMVREGETERMGTRKINRDLDCSSRLKTRRVLPFLDFDSREDFRKSLRRRKREREETDVASCFYSFFSLSLFQRVTLSVFSRIRFKMFVMLFKDILTPIFPASFFPLPSPLSFSVSEQENHFHLLSTFSLTTVSPSHHPSSSLSSLHPLHLVSQSRSFAQCYTFGQCFFASSVTFFTCWQLSTEPHFLQSSRY